MNQPQFTFKYIEEQFRSVLKEGYNVITCEEFVRLKQKGTLIDKILVNRVDIDFSVKKARRLLAIFNTLGIRSTFFVRLHAPEYNPFSFENYLILKDIVASGHEIGYHSEVIDQSIIWKENAIECLKRDLDILNRMFDVKVTGVASHGGMTGFNNLDFWKDKTPKEFGLLYEGYDREKTFNLFHESFYVSDSEWIKWKCYNKGKLQENDRRSLAEHAMDGHKLIYSLIHPDTYFDSHYYENEK